MEAAWLLGFPLNGVVQGPAASGAALIRHKTGGCNGRPAAQRVPSPVALGNTTPKCVLSGDLRGILLASSGFVRCDCGLG